MNDTVNTWTVLCRNTSRVNNWEQPLARLVSLNVQYYKMGDNERSLEFIAHTFIYFGNKIFICVCITKLFLHKRCES